MPFETRLGRNSGGGAAIRQTWRREAMNLILLRHGESQWNQENRFTGWTDVPLSEEGIREAQEAGMLLRNAGFDFDVCYTSFLKRAIETLNHCLTQMDREWLPVIKSWKLNERHYGALQGLNKAETARQYGERQVNVWRRSFAVPPPLLTPDDPRTPARQEQYRGVPPELLPLGESLADTVARTVPYFEQEIRPRMRDGMRVLIAAHGNSLRGLVMHLEQLTPDEVMEVNLPTGAPLVYTLTDDMRVLSKKYLGDPKAVAEKMSKVAAQGSAQPEKQGL